MEAARQQVLGYVRALPTSEPRPPFAIMADVYSNFAGVGDNLRALSQFATVEVVG